MQDINVKSYCDNLSKIERFELRNHIGNMYMVAESLDWCDTENDFIVYEHLLTNPAKNKNEKSLLGVIKADFDDTETYEQSIEDIQLKASENNIQIKDVYRKNNQITVMLKPFVVEK